MHRERVTKTLKEERLYTAKDDRRIQIYRHNQDELVKIMEFNKIAVFFLGGDSLGESGSGQEWFQPKIFNLILDKLVDAGYIVTDGSSIYDKEINYEWKSTYKKDPDSWDESQQKPKNFTYSNRRFICIGECGGRYGTLYLWKVEIP